MSSTSSIWHTKAAFASGGMQYCSLRHGLSSFFSRSGERFRAQPVPHSRVPPVYPPTTESSSGRAQMAQENTPRRSGELLLPHPTVAVGIHKENVAPTLRSDSARQTAGSPAQLLSDLPPPPRRSAPLSSLALLDQHHLYQK